MSRQTQQRPYQGYPYVSPMVIDAPTIDAAAAARWADLPRRQIASGVRRPPQVDNSGAGSSQATDEVPIKKKDKELTPVVYIDIPEEGGSDVAQTRTDSEEEEPAYVQETILYDPFEDRRIDLTRRDSLKSANSSGSGSSSSVASGRLPGRPAPPNTLNLTTPSSSYSSPVAGISTISQGFYSTKESFVYGSHPDDSFPLSPIPVSEMAEPPPAYTEFAITQPPTREEPRTQVILPPVQEQLTPIGLPNRKIARCQHCRMNVVTIVIRESGFLTHFIAFICLLICLPLVFVVYFTKYFKYKNHFCPSCNQKIGYVYPFFDSDINYV